MSLINRGISIKAMRCKRTSDNYEAPTLGLEGDIDPRQRRARSCRRTVRKLCAPIAEAYRLGAGCHPLMYAMSPTPSNTTPIMDA